MQTILGAGGAIGTPLAKELTRYTRKIRLVSRNPKKVNDTDELFAADITNRAEVFKAIEGSEIVYLTAGFKYDSRVWQKTWPVVMQNVIDACRKYNARLVFFDNMYLYDKDHLAHMTEETPVNPSSRKGKVRALVVKMIMDEVHRGRLMALIARAPDFIGLHNSVMGEMVIKNLQKGKKAMWFADISKKKNMTFPDDAAKATAILGNTPEAYNQVWHVPSTHEALTGKEWIEMIALEFGVEPRSRVIKPVMLSFLGLFMPVMKVFKEMLYQYDRDYFFDSTRFEKRFNFQPTTLNKGIKDIVNQITTTGIMQ